MEAYCDLSTISWSYILANSFLSQQQNVVPIHKTSANAFLQQAYIYVRNIYEITLPVHILVPKVKRDVVVFERMSTDAGPYTCRYTDFEIVIYCDK